MVCRYMRALEGCMQIAFAGEMAKRRAGSIRWIERSCRLCGGQFGFRAGPCHINRLQQAREQQYGGEIVRRTWKMDPRGRGDRQRKDLREQNRSNHSGDRAQRIARYL